MSRREELVADWLACARALTEAAVALMDGKHETSDLWQRTRTLKGYCEGIRAIATESPRRDVRLQHPA